MKIGDASFESLKHALGTDGIGLKFGPYQFRIRADSPLIAKGIRTLQAHRELRGPVHVPDFVVDVEAGFHFGRRFFTYSVDGKVWHSWPKRLAVAGMEWITSWCFFRTSDRLAIHGGAAVVPGATDALVFPGVSGAGKSTLSSALMLSGWTLLSDEITSISPESLELVGLGRPTIMKGRSIDLMKETFGDKAVFGPEGKILDPPARIAHLQPTRESVEASGKPYQPRAFVFPKRDGGTHRAPRLVPIASSELFVRLTQHGINYRVLGERGFRTSLELANQIPAFELEYTHAIEAEDYLRHADFGGRHSRQRTFHALPAKSPGEENVSDIGSESVAKSNHSKSLGQQPQRRIIDSIKTINRLMLSPDDAVSLTSLDWGQIIPLANQLELLPQSASRLHGRSITRELPPQVRRRIDREQQANEFDGMTMNTELRELQRLCGGIDTRLVLLKGCAYRAAELKWARGRRSSDVDVLVEESRIDDVADALRAADYLPDETLSSRDQRYYRKWLHELPTLKHAYRGIEIDLHFRLLPLADPKTFAVQEVVERACPIPSTSFHWLDPVDRVVHACVNLGHTGEFRRAFRDLWDIRFLIEGDGGVGGFDWEVFAQRVKGWSLSHDVTALLLLGDELVGLTVPDGWIESTVGVRPERIRSSRIYRTMRRAALPPEEALRSNTRRFALWTMEHYPLPKIRTWLDPLTWTKRVKFIQGK